MLYSRFSWVIYFIRSCICICQCQLPNSSHPCFLPCCPYVCSLRLCLYFCFANRFICIYTTFDGRKLPESLRCKKLPVLASCCTLLKQQIAGYILGSPGTRGSHRPPRPWPSVRSYPLCFGSGTLHPTSSAQLESSLRQDGTKCGPSGIFHLQGVGGVFPCLQSLARCHCAEGSLPTLRPLGSLRSPLALTEWTAMRVCRRCEWHC